MIANELSANKLGIMALGGNFGIFVILALGILSCNRLKQMILPV